jgi:hypothetical protein
MSSGRIVVIVPCYNAADTINAALASVAGQTRPPDSVLLIDDASTDATLEVVNQWRSTLPLRVLRQPHNTGVGLARQRALSEADAELVTHLDADDIWLPDHLAVLEAQYAPGYIVTAGNIGWSPMRGVAYTNSLDRIPVPPADQQLWRICQANFLFTGSLYERDAALRVGGFRDFRVSEDWDLWIRLIRAGYRVRCAPHPTVLYRLHAGSLMGATGSAVWDARVLRQTAAEIDNVPLRRALLRYAKQRDARAAFSYGLGLADTGDHQSARLAWRRSLRLSMCGGLPPSRDQLLVAAQSLLAMWSHTTLELTRSFRRGRADRE